MRVGEGDRKSVVAVGDIAQAFGQAVAYGREKEREMSKVKVRTAREFEEKHSTDSSYYATALSNICNSIRFFISSRKFSLISGSCGATSCLRTRERESQQWRQGSPCGCIFRCRHELTVPTEAFIGLVVDSIVKSVLLELVAHSLQSLNGFDIVAYALLLEL
jgi:hypothetical protein